MLPEEKTAHLDGRKREINTYSGCKEDQCG
jgi:hypothetical protein